MANELKNYMTDNNLYIITGTYMDVCNEAITNLSQWVDAKPYTDVKENVIFKPLETIPEHINVLNVYLASDGGATNVCRTFITLFNMAKAKNIIIKTHNLSFANSSASMLAISGTPGYRYMAHNAMNAIHYGKSTTTINHMDEIQYARQSLDTHLINMKKIYLESTQLTEDELTRYLSTEYSGELNAAQCLEKGLCDWVITPHGWTNNVKDLVDQNIR